MKKTKIIFLLGILLMPSLYSQQIYFVPSVGVGKYISRIENLQKSTEAVTISKFQNNSILYDFNFLYHTYKRTFSFGYKYTFAGVGIRYLADQKTSNYSSTGGNSGYGSYRGIDQHNLGFKYYVDIKGFNFLNSKSNKANKNFKLQLMAGADFSITGWTTSNMENIIWQDTDTADVYFAPENIVRGHHKYYGISTNLGVRIQKTKNDRLRYALELWYSQGLSDKEIYDYRVIFNTKYVTTAKIHSRGSYWGFTFSYPILVWRKK